MTKIIDLDILRPKSGIPTSIHSAQIMTNLLNSYLKTKPFNLMVELL